MTQAASSIMAAAGLSRTTLVGQTAIVTGAGGGIGLEAARALLWLGASVVIAEIDTASGVAAEAALAAEFGAERVAFIETDVGEEASVTQMVQAAEARFGRVDIVINNATIARLGLVKNLPIEAWDASYRVNLRGPVLLARACLPGMLRRDAGVFACVSSTGTAFMGAYETFKAAQVHLGHTLDAELEGTGVCAFTIGPGLVATETAVRAIDELAPHMGMSVDEFFAHNAGAVLSAEEAGAGFAAAVVLAERFRGQEISSMQALKALQPAADSAPHSVTPAAAAGDALELCRAALATLREQLAGWKQRSLFERQWMLRDFKKQAGMPAEQWLEALQALEVALVGGGPPAASIPPLERLAGYYSHLAELARGYEKDPARLEESLSHIYAWQAEVEALRQALGPAPEQA
jgi:NAD(P)-dependent dehydrogenase (short-subunit alcohol dehydrogenase family)